MRFTNAFLTALLFCGVTPLAINKKKDEHGLEIIPSLFITPLSVALVPPNEAGVGGITDGTHNALEAKHEAKVRYPADGRAEYQAKTENWPQRKGRREVHG